MDRVDFSAYFHLNSPASAADIAGAETALGFSLPESYIALLKVTDGLSCHGNLVLLEASDLASRNSDYEVSEYLPGYLMIGDDSGGVALVMQIAGQAVYEVDMGVMDASELRKSADSLEQLLLELGGKTLGEREWPFAISPAGLIRNFLRRARRECQMDRRQVGKSHEFAIVMIGVILQNLAETFCGGYASHS